LNPKKRQLRKITLQIVEVYRFWMHTFSHADLESILLPVGFTTAEYYDGIIPDSEMYSSSSVTFCLAVK
jgi:hypothetical protein